MPNAANIYALIRDIEAEEIMKLNMNVTRKETDCGTMGCIMGFVAAKEGSSRPSSLLVSEHLEIDLPTARELCWADSMPDLGFSMTQLTKPIVIAALEDLAAGQFHSWKPYL